MTKRLTQILFSISLCLFVSQLNAQTFSCQNSIYVSMDATCSLTITPAMIASGIPPAGAVVTVMNGTTVIPQPLTSVNVGKTYTVKLAIPNGNACWGTAKIEDKAAPVLTCASSPQNINCAIQNLNIATSPKVVFDNIPDNGIADTNIAASIFGNPAVAENCGLYTLSYSDDVDDKDCNAVGLSAVVTRTWTAIDPYNNKSTCTIAYNLQRQPLTAVVFPADITLSCSATFALDANGNPAVSVAKAPQINSVDIFPTMAGFCEINANYHDKKVNTCGSTYEILRKWTVIDMCGSAVSTKLQIIKVLDVTAPVIQDICPLADVTVTTNTGCVLSNYPVPAIKVTDNCDANPVISATILQGGLTVTGGLTVSNLSIGEYVINYTATDACGNSTFCTRKLSVKDLTPPVAVCDLNTKISINTAGKASLPAIDINDNSLDNCCLDVSRFEIKRMSEPDAAYKPALEINCSDVQLMVALRVWDCNNNSNVCMVNVLVEDKLPPVAFGRDTIVCCSNTPAAGAWLNINLLKQKTLIDYPTANNPGYYDNCAATPSYAQSGSIDNCGNGTVKNTVTVKDASGLSATTVINYISENRSAYTVTFPADVTLTCTSNKQYATDPASAGKPDVKNLGTTCPLVGVEYTDNVFKVVPDACFKIIRTWKVLNWCQPQANFNGNKGDLRKTGQTCVAQDRTYTNIDMLRPDRVSSILAAGAPCLADMQALVNGESCYTYDTDGYMEYQQVIKVIDLTAPTLVAGKITVVPVGKLCKANVTIEKPTSTDCTGATSDSYEILKFGTTTVVTSGNSFPYIKDFSDSEFGDYTVRFKTTDQCGNFTSTDVKISIKDVTKPTPICHSWIAVNLMASGMVMLDAKVIDAGSYDNCTPQNKLKFKIQFPAPTPADMPNPDTLKSIFTFNCQSDKIIPIGDGYGYLANVALWVGDEAGNWDYCETVVNVQDNMVVCNYVPIQMKNLAGAIVTEKNTSIENVKMLLDGTKKQELFSTITGKILFKDLPVVGNYSVVPEKDVLPLNGVSTLDLVLISKHILGTQPLNSPYQQIAADVNKNGSVTTADLVELRKMILGIQANFTKNTSWRFVDKKFSFAANQNPLQQAFPEKIDFTSVIGTDEANFIGVKIGDVNGNAATSGTAAGRGDIKGLINISTDEKTYNVGDEVKMTLTAEKAIEAYQMTLNYDKNNLELLEIQGNTENFAVLENGVVTVSALNSKPTNEMFTLIFKAKKEGSLSENTRISAQITNKEAYDNQGNTYDLALNFANKSKSSVLELFQNRPNPFQNETTIAFNLPKTGTAKITISDVAGKVLQVIENDFVKGYNELKINKNALQTSGVMYIQLEQNGMKVTKKMISIE